MTEEKTRGIGDNSVAGEELKQLIERIERLEEEKKALADDIKDVFSEAKGRGFDTAVMRAIIRAKKQNRSERQEFEAIYELYCRAIGLDFMI